MQLLQILIIAFALFALSRTLLRVKDKAVPKIEFFLWVGVWGIVIVLASLPSVMTYLTKPLGIARGVDIIIYGSIILLFYLIFRLYVKTEQTNQEITKIVQRLAQEKVMDKAQEEQKRVREKIVTSEKRK